MTTLKRYIINSVTLHPTEIKIDDLPIEDSDRMANGTLRIWHRTFKKKWTLSWSGLVESSVAAIRTLYRTTSAVTLNDENNTNYTVIARSFNESLSAEREANGVLYYDIEASWEEI